MSWCLFQNFLEAPREPKEVLLSPRLGLDPQASTATQKMPTSRDRRRVPTTSTFNTLARLHILLLDIAIEQLILV